MPAGTGLAAPACRRRCRCCGGGGGGGGGGVTGGRTRPSKAVTSPHPSLACFFYFGAKIVDFERLGGGGRARARERARNLCRNGLRPAGAGRNVGWRGKAWSALRVRAAALAHGAWAGVAYSESQRALHAGARSTPSCTTLAAIYATPAHAIFEMCFMRQTISSSSADVSVPRGHARTTTAPAGFSLIT